MTTGTAALADDDCYLALKARDARFDGSFFRHAAQAAQAGQASAAWKPWRSYAVIRAWSGLLGSAPPCAARHY